MLSYSAVLPYEKATLPSVEMWGTNMNILKDPPKGIFTRRKDRVGDTQQILLQQDDSGSRVNEFINVYARNTNPMVGISYNNYGNSQRSSISGAGGGGSRQATLPYKVDVVRPPILSPYDLQPLSRLPRDWFYASTNPEFPGLVQNLQCKGIDKNIEAFNLRSNLNVEPNKSGNADTTSEANRTLQTNRNLTTPLHYDFETTKTSQVQKSGALLKDLKSVREKSLLSKDVQSSRQMIGNQVLTQPLKKLNDSKRPKNTTSVSSNVSIKSTPMNKTPAHLTFPLANKPKAQNVQTQKSSTLHFKPQTPIQELFLTPKIPHHSMVSNQSSYQQILRSDKLRELERKSPITEEVSTARLFNFETLDNIMNRKKQLLDRLSSYGSFDNAGSGIPNPSGIQDRNVSTTSSIDNSRSAFKARMQEYMAQ